MDRVSRKVRSKVMSSVKSKGTRLEDNLWKAIKKARFERIERNAKRVDGRPDFVFRKSRVAIFVDSCFWHGCRWHCRMPATNVKYWEWKIKYNRQRDKRVTHSLRHYGWKVIRVWEHAIRDEEGVGHVIKKLKSVLGKQTS